MTLCLGAVLCLAGGCEEATVPRVSVPPPVVAGRVDQDPIKPMPASAQSSDMAAPPFYDPPLVTQETPEQESFVNAYNAVGRPKITVFVNRTMNGLAIPVNPAIPIPNNGAYNDTTKPPAYLAPGEYDEAQAKSLDYEAIESTLTDWLSAGGHVTIISPVMARERLAPDEVHDLQTGAPQALGEIAQRLNADILVQVEAHPTRQTAAGLEVRIIAEAINTRGGQSLGRALVDVLPPLEKETINDSTRFLARKLMSEMMNTWATPAPAGAPAK
jgi:hypothetical protein